MKTLLLIIAVVLVAATGFAKPLLRPKPSAEQQLKDLGQITNARNGRRQYLQRRYDRRYGPAADLDYCNQSDEEWERQQQLDEIEDQLNEIHRQQQIILDNRRILPTRRIYMLDLIK